MTFRIRALALGLFALRLFGQTSGNFELSMEPATLAVAADTNAKAEIKVLTSTHYSQPVYLIAGPMPQGISVAMPSPVVGGQAVKIEVRVGPSVKPQSYALTVYAGSGGENETVSFTVEVLPVGTVVTPPEVVPEAPMPVAPPAIEQPPVPELKAESPAEPPPPPLGTHWVGSWGASAVTPSNESGAYYLTNVTVRQIAHLSIGSLAGLRIRLSNALGRDAVTFASVQVAQWAGDSKTVTSSILPETNRAVTFSGSKTVVIPGGGEVLSDPIALPLPAGADLAVSLYIPKTSNVPATMHQFGNQTAFFSLGDSASSTSMPNAATDTVRPYLTGVEVDAPGAIAVVALGDSLTDGMASARDQNLRWTDDLARRLQGAAADRLAVVNEGIAGNCVLMNCMGPNVPDRFKRDVLAVAGVKYLIVQAGANDIGHSPELTAAQLSDAYSSMVALAHANNILVYGATIPPFGGSNYFTPTHEKIRQQVNSMIRSGLVFDGVIDFDQALADPKNPAYLRAEYNGDKIRPNDAGYHAMADKVDLGLFNPNPR